MPPVYTIMEHIKFKDLSIGIFFEIIDVVDDAIIAPIS